MMDDDLKQKLSYLLRAAQPAATLVTGCRESLLSRIEVKRKRQVSRFRSWVMAGIAAVIVLSVLGLIPSTQTQASGAWGMAVWEAQHADSLHVVARSWPRGRETVTKFWSSKEGGWRLEYWVNGSLERLQLYGPTSKWDYDGPEKAGREVPQFPYMDGWILNTSVFGNMSALFSDLHEYFGLTVTERRNVATPEGLRCVIEAEGVGNGAGGLLLIDFTSGVPIKVTAEIDESTKRPVSLKILRREGNTWKVAYQTEKVEWDIALPAGIEEFTPPAGAEIKRVTWWSDRADKMISDRKTKDWNIVLQAVDVNRSGDLFLTVRRTYMPSADPDDHPDPMDLFSIDAQDDTGTKYRQEDSSSGVENNANGHYNSAVILILRREKETASAPLPASVTLTIRPYSGCRQQATFQEVPLPPRQDTDNPLREAIEVVKY
jgi:hypothetical protein